MHPAIDLWGTFGRSGLVRPVLFGLALADADSCRLTDEPGDSVNFVLPFQGACPIESRCALHVRLYPL